MPKKTGLRTPQIRILRALAQYPGGLTRSQIAAKAKVSMSMTGNLGPMYSEDVKQSEMEYGKKSLMGLGYVIAIVNETETMTDYVITYHITRSGKDQLKMIDQSSVKASTVG